ncbi:tRNA pseudouridine(55) synthase TruB, partial [Deinococcus sp. 6YEL10]|nr:tRNA pseudouridine(55) synthase TruB [Deinococcus sp. 6YEL10]
AATLDGLPEAAGIPDLAALDFPVIEADDRVARELRQGKRPAHSAQGRHVVTLNGELVAVVDGNGEQLKVVRSWA